PRSAERSTIGVFRYKRACRIADHSSAGRDRPRDNGAHPDHCIAPDNQGGARSTLFEDSPRADIGAIFNYDIPEALNCRSKSDMLADDAVVCNVGEKIHLKLSTYPNVARDDAVRADNGAIADFVGVIDFGSWRY